MRFALWVVAAIALATVLARSARVGLAGDYVDPVGRVTAQDEALYANSSIRMATQGGWLTPEFMGRYALYKPPMLYWLSAASARTFGISKLSLRLPVAVLAAISAGLLFLWVAELAEWAAAALALALLVSNHLWHVLSGMAMTDGLLTAFTVAAVYALFADPWLESKWALWGFAGAVACAILTKGMAGVLPLVVLGAYWIVAPRKYRPRFLRVVLAGGLAVALAAPWFCYQLAVHGRWFRTEHVAVEILGYGAGAPPQTSAENPALFYAMRMALTDPMLLAAALVAVPALILALRHRSAPAVLLACWLGVTGTAVLGWQYRNAAYLLPMVPALAILAAAYGPLAAGTPSKGVLAIALALVVAKAITPGAPWGMSFAKGTVQPLAAPLQSYCEMGRSSELIVVGMGDDLYAAALPLARLRYALVGAPALPSGPYIMNFPEMGIVVTAGQFDHLAQWLPIFRERLKQWGLDSTAPVGTLIEAATPAELTDVVRAHPDSDFLMPDRYAGMADAAHVRVEAFPDHYFLLSRHVEARRAPTYCTAM
jgi:hypothetical protein